MRSDFASCLLRPPLISCARAAAVRLLSAGPQLQGLPGVVHRAFEQELNVPAGAPLLVSVSGGSDSVALLRVLLALHPRWRWRLHAVHFNHGFRKESDAEEAFVRALTSEHDVPLHVRRLPPSWAAVETEPPSGAIGAHGDRGDDGDDGNNGVHAGDRGDRESLLHPHGITGSGGGMQARTRRWRRAESLAILESLEAATDSAAGAVALVHHSDDQVETVLLKALRGAHLTNLSGMQWQNGRFVRPLLGLRKAELVAYLHAIGQEWMEDSSNAVPRYKRNKVRLELIPLLEELAGGAGGLASPVEALAWESREAREWLEAASRAHLETDPSWQGASSFPHRGLSVDRLRRAAPLVRDELLVTLVRTATQDPHSSITNAAIRKTRRQLESEATEWTLDVSAACSIRRMGNLLTAVQPSGSPLKSAAGARRRALVGDGSQRGDAAAGDATGRKLALGRATLVVGEGASHWTVAAGWGTAPSATASRGMDAGAAAGVAEAATREVRLHNLSDDVSLEVRTWREGDHFHPKWKPKPERLVAFLRGQKVPLAERRTLPLICRAGSAEVLAVLPIKCKSSLHIARGLEGREDEDFDGNQVLWVSIQDPGSGSG